MITQRWTKYFEETKGNPPRSLLVKALQFVSTKEEAIDLGAGALNDSKYLLEQGFERVTALDKEPVARKIAELLPKERFTYTIEDFETYKFPVNKFDLVNAQYSLPFINPEAFEMVFRDIVSSMREGGIFVGQLFGDGDEWEDNKNMNFHTLEEVKTMLADLEVLYFEEEDKEKRVVVSGKMKHWHVFHFIARK